ncbi:hypothetical protein P3342_000432 [Pyrenophora teres f. teres]|nr:hypothetical protein P3342_000432 [Pyrenophora teres f. teres]
MVGAWSESAYGFSMAEMESETRNVRITVDRNVIRCATRTWMQMNGERWADGFQTFRAGWKELEVYIVCTAWVLLSREMGFGTVTSSMQHSPTASHPSSPPLDLPRPTTTSHANLQPRIARS